MREFKHPKTRKRTLLTLCIMQCDLLKCVMKIKLQDHLYFDIRWTSPYIYIYMTWIGNGVG